MKATYFIFVFILSCLIYSCWGDNPYKIIRTFTITGTVTDKENNQPVAGVPISVDAIEPLGTPGFGGIRKHEGQGITDANGHYSINVGIFKGVQSLQLFVNQGNGNTGYWFSNSTVNIADLNPSKSNNKDFTLVPLAILNVNYKNITRYSDSDLFRFYVFSNPSGEVVNRTYCGSIHEDSLDASWTGKDVCGTNSLMEAADHEAIITWDVYRKGVHNSFEDSVFVKRGVVTNFDINY